MSRKYKYMLRTCKADMTSYGGFKRPRRGVVVALDWDPSPECGNGLHGFLNGCGNGELANWDADAVWMVCRIDGAIVDLRGKIKTDRCTVVYCGDRKTATDRIRKLCGDGAVIGCFVSGGDGATVSGGDGATVSGGDGATVSGGNRATVSGRDWATVSGGYGATVSGGYGATVSGGYGATVSGGDGATVSGGYGATVSGGNRATVSGGDGATVSGGDGAILQVKWYDGDRYRIAVGYVGEDGIESGKKYRCEKGKFVEVVSE